MLLICLGFFQEFVGAFCKFHVCSMQKRHDVTSFLFSRLTFKSKNDSGQLSSISNASFLFEIYSEKISANVRGDHNATPSPCSQNFSLSQVLNFDGVVLEIYDGSKITSTTLLNFETWLAVGLSRLRSVVSVVR